MTDKPYAPRLVHLPGTALSPEVVLHRTLNKLPHIKAVSIVIQWNDDTYSADWSQQKVSELCLASLTFDDEVRDIAMGRKPPQ